MPTIITCPSCTKQLRLPDDLLGKSVQCPSCRHFFESGASSAPAPPPRPLESSAPASRPLETSAPPRSSTNSAGGIDLKLSLDDEPRQEPRPQPLSDPAARQSAESIPPWRPLSTPVDDPKGEDAPAPRMEDEDRRPERDADRDRDRSRDRDRDYDRDRDRDWRRGSDRDRDWERPRGRGRDRYGDEDSRRRDTVPHRGGLILTLGVVGLSLLTVGFLFPISLVLGLCAWVMGSNDLRKMNAGEMDADGRSNTQGGYICGIISTVISGLGTLACAGFFILIIVAESNRSTSSARPRGGLPAATTKGQIQNKNPGVPINNQEDDGER